MDGQVIWNVCYWVAASESRLEVTAPYNVMTVMSLLQIVWGLMIDEAARARQVNDLKDEPFFPARCMISLSNISSFVHCKACNGISI